MSRVLKIVRNGTDLIDLLAGTASNWAMIKYVPEVTKLGEPVEETIRAHVLFEDDDDALASEIQKLDDVVSRVHDYGQGRYLNPTWLHTKMNSETNERRAAIKDIDYSIKTGLVDQRGYAAGHSAVVEINLRRQGGWEVGSAEMNSLVYNPSGNGDFVKQNLWVQGTAVPGNLSARIDVCNFTGQDHFETFFLGVRSDDFIGCSAGNYRRNWDLANGSADASDASKVEDDDAFQGAYGGTSIRVVKSAEDWDGDDLIKVCSIRLGNVCSIEDHYKATFGLHRWLLRSKVGSDSEWIVQLRYGIKDENPDIFIRGQQATVTVNKFGSPIWKLLDMGAQQIPNRDFQTVKQGSTYDYSQESDYEVQVWARRTDGSSYLKVDCLGIVPMDEAYLFAQLPIMETATFGGKIIFAENESGKTELLQFEDYDEQWLPTGNYEVHNFRVPVGKSRVFFVTNDLHSQGYTKHQLDSLFFFNISGNDKSFYTPRWRSLRGNE